MLGIESQNLLRDFLKLMGRLELQTERQRQKLASLNDFEPYSAFCRINRNETKQICATEIHDFLQ
jgi:hypothetical protein